MTKSIVFFSTLILVSLAISSCNSATKEKNEEPSQNKIESGKYSIASSEYEQLADKALVHIANFQFPELYEMVSEDIEYYLPDGGETSRTRFIGKEAFMGFWDSYQEKSGNTKITLSNPAHLPINVHQKLNYTNVTGVMVLLTFRWIWNLATKKLI